MTDKAKKVLVMGNDKTTKAICIMLKRKGFEVIRADKENLDKVITGHEISGIWLDELHTLEILKLYAS